MRIVQFLLRQLHIDDPQQMKVELSWLWKRMREYRQQILLVALLGLGGTAMSLISSVASKYLIDAVTGFGSIQILPAAIWMLGMLFGSLVLQAVSSRISAQVHVTVRNRMQHTTYGKVLRAAWQSLEPYRSGDLLNRLSNDISVTADGIIGFLPSLLTSCLKFGGAFLIMLVFDPVMALIALVGAPVTLLVGRALLRKLRRQNQDLKDLAGEVMSFQEDSFRNLTSIKAFSATDRYTQQMADLQSQYATAYISFNNLQVNLSTCLSVVSTLVSTACFGWGIYQLWNGAITYGSMTMFLSLAGTLRGSFSAMVGLAQQLISLSTSAGRLLAVEELPGEDTQIPEGFDREDFLRIRLKGVSFNYQNGDTVLQPFDFSAEPGDQIAIIGPSGEGKTTLLRLLLGLVEPCQGSAQLLGRYGDYTISAGTRPGFSYVPQGNSVFAGTIAENLRIIAPDATEEEMVQALKTACAWDFVSQLPQQLHHSLGAGGRGISEGQAQRLAIARALLHKAPILLLDEATSGLDEATERRLMQNLKNCGSLRTCILVTHRPSSAEFCNRTYEIRQGGVSEVPYVR